MSTALRLLTLTEDTGDDAGTVLCEICSRLLRAVAPNANLDRVQFIPSSEKARGAMGFLAFRARKGHKERVILAREIVDRLTDDGPPTFVALHTDGDLPWAESEGGTRSKNLDVLQSHLLDAVASALEDRGQPSRRDHLLLVLPYYCVEAWLYQNISELRALTAHLPATHEDHRTLAAWEADPGSLDEVHGPKEALSIRDRHNLQLARKLPGRKLLEVGKSFAATAARWRACQPLVAALSVARYP